MDIFNLHLYAPTSHYLNGSWGLYCQYSFGQLKLNSEGYWDNVSHSSQQGYIPVTEDNLNKRTLLTEARNRIEAKYADNTVSRPTDFSWKDVIVTSAWEVGT